MQVAFYRGGRTLLDRAICLLTRSQYSHCELVFRDNLWFSASAVDKGTYLRPYIPIGSWDYIELPCCCDEQVASYYAKQMVGMPYDYLGVARFVLPFIRQDYDRWFCSELVACTLFVAGLRLEKQRQPFSYSPGSLYHALVGRKTC